MASTFDKGMNADHVSQVAADMGQEADKAKQEVEKVLAELQSINASWFGARGADMLNKINQAEGTIQQYHIEMKEMNRILTETVHVFQEFDQQTN